MTRRAIRKRESGETNKPISQVCERLEPRSEKRVKKARKLVELRKVLARQVTRVSARRGEAHKGWGRNSRSSTGQETDFREVYYIGEKRWSVQDSTAT